MLLFKKIIVIIVLVLASSVYASSDIDMGESPEYVFYQGNTHYKNGLHDEALAEYSKVTADGLESGNLYFNMGNAYFKKGELGKAVLYYERAQRFIPNDSDLKSNYKYAISRLQNIAADTERSFIHNILSRADAFTIEGLTLLLSALYICIVLFLIAIMYFRNIKRPAVVSITILSVLWVLTAYTLYDRASAIDKEAIVVFKEAEARFEPIESATVHFSLSEGMKVQIVESKSDWLKVKRKDGKSGWISKGSAEKIGK